MTLATEQILERLVNFPTVSSESNLPLIDWIRNFLADHGIESHLVLNEKRDKANLLATIGPPLPGGLGLSGHSDVVPVQGQAWNSDPFTLTEKQSRLYGRGSCDMKGFIAAALSRVASWKSTRLRRPMHLLFTYDEEVGCLGAPSLVANAEARQLAPAAIIVGEPTSMRVATRHKGICTLRTSVSGIEAHSSLTHQGISAVMLAAEVVAYLGRIASALANNPRICGKDSQQSSGFEPAHTSLSVNRIQGGTATNILAANCEFHWDIRTLPNESPAEVIGKLQAFVQQTLARLACEGKRCSIETTVLTDVPALETDQGRAVELAHEVLKSATGDAAAPFATDGGYFQRAGWSTVVCGPGSIEQAHKPDEFIERTELRACEKFLDAAIQRQCC
jgi:acetylornithine deacetylase